MIGEGTSGVSNLECIASVVRGIMNLGPGSEKSSVRPRRCAPGFGVIFRRVVGVSLFG